MIEFIAVKEENRSVFIQLNVEYLTWINTEVKNRYQFDLEEQIGTTVEAYVEQSVNDLIIASPHGTPQGIFFFVTYEGKIAGMGGLKQLEPEIGEIKRMFVRPEFRGKGLGQAILKKLLAQAHEFGFTSVRLDTAGFMTSAHKLYQALGFNPIDNYPQSEGQWIEDLGVEIIYMEKKL